MGASQWGQTLPPRHFWSPPKPDPLCWAWLEQPSHRGVPSLPTVRSLCCSWDQCSASFWTQHSSPWMRGLVYFKTPGSQDSCPARCMNHRNYLEVTIRWSRSVVPEAGMFLGLLCRETDYLHSPQACDALHSLVPWTVIIAFWLENHKAQDSCTSAYTSLLGQTYVVFF